MAQAVESKALASAVELDAATGAVKIVANTSVSRSSIRTRTPTPGMLAPEEPDRALT